MFSVTATTWPQLDLDAVVCFVAPGASPSAPLGADAELATLLAEVRSEGAFTGNSGESVLLRLRQAPVHRVVVGGIGDAPTAHSLVRAGAAAMRTAQKSGARRIGLFLQGHDDHTRRQLALGAAAGAYRFERYRKVADGETSITIVATADGEAWVKEADAIAAGESLARDLVNTSPSDKLPMQLAERIAAIGQQEGFAVEVIDDTRLRAMGAGGIVGTGQGSANPPCAVIMRYRGAGGTARGLLGKGITFDSGGLSLKTNEGMKTMKGDMAGAAAVIGAMVAIARLKPAQAVTAAVMLAENMPSGTAMRDGDVLHMLGGKTVEILSTDAEGRLVLADGVELLRREGVSSIVDLATLTGAQVIALGSVRAAYLASDDALASELEAASASSGDRIWRMPTDEDYREALKSPVADIRNSGDRGAGLIFGGLFIGEFRGDTPWAHLDIAGLTFRASEAPPFSQGGTGYGVRLLTDLVLKSR